MPVPTTEREPVDTMRLRSEEFLNFRLEIKIWLMNLCRNLTTGNHFDINSWTTFVNDGPIVHQQSGYDNLSSSLILKLRISIKRKKNVKKTLNCA